MSTSPEKYEEVKVHNHEKSSEVSKKRTQQRVKKEKYKEVKRSENQVDISETVSLEELSDEDFWYIFNTFIKNGRRYKNAFKTKKEDEKRYIYMEDGRSKIEKKKINKKLNEFSFAEEYRKMK